MSKVTSLTVALIGCALFATTAESQTLDARRLGMGGVVTSDVGDFSGSNIAFRAVPKGAGGTGSIPLPLGLIQYLSDHPVYDSKDSLFNIYKIANVFLNPPLTIQLVKPKEVSGDISIFVAQDSLKVDLADVKRVIPENSMKQGGVIHLFGNSQELRERVRPDRPADPSEKRAHAERPAAEGAPGRGSLHREHALRPEGRRARSGRGGLPGGLCRPGALPAPRKRRARPIPGAAAPRRSTWEQRPSTSWACPMGMPALTAASRRATRSSPAAIQ